MKNLQKILAALLALAVSPFLILSVAGAVYILIQRLRGIPFVRGFHLFIGLVVLLKPYFPILTGIPLLILLIVFLSRRLRH